MMSRADRVRLAVIALCAAWVLSAIALAINQFVFHGSGIGPGLTIGIASLVVQAVVIVFVARGSTIAQMATVVFLALAAISLPMLPRLIAERSIWSAIYIALGFVLKAMAVWLLFFGRARR
jgi:hypothetical protein